MSDETLLSQLCNIWYYHPTHICHETSNLMQQASHINAPKYRCPRCSVRTCSLPCSRKHKTWSSCTGVRDPAAYLTRSQLANEASFDRDFNFITSIERRLERAERDAENRGIELEHEYMVKPTGDQNKSHGKKRKRGLNGEKQAPKLVKGELGFMRAAQESGVKLVRAPAGLSRRKMNHSKIHPKHKCLNWSVEWIIPSTGQRIVRPCLETTPLKDAYDRIFPTPKGDGNIVSTDEQKTSTGDGAENANSHRDVFFYLHRHRSATKDIVLIPLQPAAKLRDTLRGKSVLEFPTIYILDYDLGWQEGNAKSLGKDMSASPSTSTSTDKRKFVLEELYLKVHPEEAESQSGDDEEEEEEEEDYTSSEGSSSDSSSDDENISEDESELELEGEAGTLGNNGPGRMNDDKSLTDQV